ncbi:AlbA family DNA-binding domain-containing protein [Clostridium senegalense]|uniref:AlbA family DNA-binding domain-containing protein n=1 Tax=Clostridium senegalense TaxID=1465809 RepID=UPI001C0FB33B|nr:RNA-binding domain-containing protein [Clostridium senegalense]MBU5226225.1 putative DNA binding domain-containing protein [Clostridium senegalense]
MDVRKVKTLLKKEEGTKLDFKRKIDIYSESGKKELAKDVCAIANSRGGRGYIIIGVEDKSKDIVGVYDERLVEEKVQQIISSRCEPPIPVSLEFVKYKGKRLGVIIIYTSEQRPYQIRENGAFYVRRGSTTDTMRRDEIISMFSSSLSFNIEITPLINSSTKSLMTPRIYRYFKLKGFEFNKSNLEELMEDAGIIYTNKDNGKKLLTLGGALIFSNIPSIYVPQNMIKIINKLGNRKNEVIIIEGNLLNMINESEEILLKILPKEYPKKTVIEAVNNAIIYRDYSIYNKFIEVILSGKSVVISSPGCLLKTFDSGKVLYGKRNMWLYEKIITLDDRGRFLKRTSGFAIIKKSFRKKGKVHFINDEEKNLFKVVLPGIRNFTNNLLFKNSE